MNPFANWTQSDIDAQNRKASGVKPILMDDVDAAQWPGPENELHEQVMAYCKQRKWPYVHSRMDKRSHTALGVPDFVIAMGNGVTAWVECKKRGGKVKPEQAGFIMALKIQGHKAGVVFSMEDFLALIES